MSVCLFPAASPRPYYFWPALSSIFILLPFDPFAHFPSSSHLLHTSKTANASAMSATAEKTSYVEFLGPLLIGVTGNAIVFGICCMQLVTYIASKYDDSPKLRCVPASDHIPFILYFVLRGRLGGISNALCQCFGPRRIGS